MIDLQLAIPARADRRFQHLDLEVAAAFLRSAGFEVSLSDAAVEPAMITGMPSGAVYWHLPSRSSFRALSEAAVALRSRVGHPWMLAGGSFASLNDFQVLQALPQVDAVVRGELELPLQELLCRLAAGEAWKSCPNLTVRAERGPVRNAFGLPPIDLSRLPRAADDLFHPSRLEAGQQVLFSRGCNSNCRYCTLQVVLREGHPGRQHFWRSRPALAIVDEIEYYLRRHGVRRFVFTAGVFFGYDEGGSQVVEQVAREILRRGLDIRFKIVTHPGHLVRNRALLPLLESAGLEIVYLGIDSGAPASLRRYDVEFDAADSLAALELLHGRGLAFTPGFIFFEPYMNLDDAEDQVSFLCQAQPFFAHMPPSYPFFLERHLLGSSLEIKPFMPLMRSLREDGLVGDEGGLTDSPRVRFRDARVARLSRFWRATARPWLVGLRPLLWNRPATETHPVLATLPLDLLSHALRRLRAHETSTHDELALTAAVWVRHVLGKELPDMMAAARLNERQRQRVVAAVAQAQASASAS